MIGIKEAISKFMADWHECHYCDTMNRTANMADDCICNDCLQGIDEIRELEPNA